MSTPRNFSSQTVLQEHITRDLNEHGVPYKKMKTESLLGIKENNEKTDAARFDNKAACATGVASERDAEA